MADATSDLLAAVLAATPDRKSAALRVLRGEDSVGGGEKRNALPERFVTQRELGRMLGVSAISLWRWRVPGHELGGRRRFRVGEVLAYLESPEFREVAEGLKAARRERSRAIADGEEVPRRKRGRPCVVV